MVNQRIFKTRIDDRGRIYIPKAVREKFKLQSDQTLIIVTEQESFTVYPSHKVERRIVAVLSGTQKKKEA